MAKAKTLDQNTWAMASHLSGFLGFIVPFANIAVPALIWLTKGKESAFVATEAKESTNFQISITIYTIIATVLSIILIGIPIIIAIIIFEVIFIIKAAVATNKGQSFRYPATLRFIK